MWDTMFSFAIWAGRLGHTWLSLIWDTTIDIEHVVLRCQQHATQPKRQCLVSPLWTLDSFYQLYQMTTWEIDQFEHGHYPNRRMFSYNDQWEWFNTKQGKCLKYIFRKAIAHDVPLLILWLMDLTLADLRNSKPTTCYYFGLIFWHGNIGRDNRFQWTRIHTKIFIPTDYNLASCWLLLQNTESSATK